jgi:hypothetical protein
MGHAGDTERERLDGLIGCVTAGSCVEIEIAGTRVGGEDS